MILLLAREVSFIYRAGTKSVSGGKLQTFVIRSLVHPTFRRLAPPLHKRTVELCTPYLEHVLTEIISIENAL